MNFTVNLTPTIKAALLGVLGLGACAPAPAAADYQTVDIAALRSAHAQGAYVLDVRTPAEYAGGHIDGAVLIPLAELSGRVNEVPRDRDVYVICRSGSRSAQASSLLAGAGHGRIINVSGGMNAWQSAGYLVSR